MEAERAKALRQLRQQIADALGVDASQVVLGGVDARRGRRLAEVPWLQLLRNILTSFATAANFN